MDEWELDFEWLKIRHYVKDVLATEKLPDMDAILFLVGIQELGQLKESFTKEEKQDLMHIAVCRLLSNEGYFEFVGIDADGWPHWKQVVEVDAKGMKAQEALLKANIIRYFKEIS
jgi:hypothetical protein